jgi:hypothetical protein
MNRTATHHDTVIGCTERPSHHVHDRTRAPGTPWPRTAGMLAPVILVALESTARAGATPQGTDYQGTIYQDSADPDSATRGGFLEANELIGWFPGDETGRELEIRSFRGNSVHATVHDASGSRNVEYDERGQLNGMEWRSKVCGPGASCMWMTYRIKDVVKDDTSNTMPGHSSNHDIWLYEVEFTDRAEPTPGDWMNVCDSLDGERALGMFVNGRWYQDGSWKPDGYTFSCLRGVIAKCARHWGYKPWKKLAYAGHGDVSLLPLHLACVRAARADYCGDGFSHTHDGTLIDIADRYDFNIHGKLPGFQDEAAFDEYGASWVRAPRWPTAHRVRNSWQFATCALPSTPRHGTAGSPLLYVQSKTSPGQSVRQTHD